MVVRSLHGDWILVKFSDKADRQTDVACTQPLYYICNIMLCNHHDQYYNYVLVLRYLVVYFVVL